MVVHKIHTHRPLVVLPPVDQRTGRDDEKALKSLGCRQKFRLAERMMETLHMPIVLVRHGFADLRLPDPGLSDFGRRQVASLAKELEKLRDSGGLAASQVRSSPRKRTIETSEAIAGALDLTIHIDADLREGHAAEGTAALDRLHPQTLVAVTHEDVIEAFLGIWVRDRSEVGCPRGTGWIIHWESSPIHSQLLVPNVE
jgi:phosphohistidine phosphatase SixA